MDSLFSRLETDARRKREERALKKKSLLLLRRFLRSRVFNWFDFDGTYS